MALWCMARRGPGTDSGERACSALADGRLRWEVRACGGGTRAVCSGAGYLIRRGEEIRRGVLDVMGAQRDSGGGGEKM